MSTTVEQGSAAAQQIIKLDGETRPWVNENEFVRRFLLTLHEYHKGNEVNIYHWLNGVKEDGSVIGATVFQSVRLDDNSGLVVGYVPPILLDPQGILPAEVTASLADIFYRAENLDNIYPGRGSKFIDEQITAQVRNKDDEAKLWKEAWDKLFVRYGLDPVYSEAVDDPETQAIANDDEGEYEDVEYL